MNSTIFSIAIALPAIAFTLLLFRPRAAFYALLAAAILLPAAVWIFPANDSDSDAPAAYDPVAAWGRGECTGKHGVGLLMRDTRIGRQPRWWVMCRDGSKAAVVTFQEFPVPDDRYAPADHPVI